MERRLPRGVVLLVNVLSIFNLAYCSIRLFSSVCARPSQALKISLMFGGTCSNADGIYASTSLYTLDSFLTKSLSDMAPFPHTPFTLSYPCRAGMKTTAFTCGLGLRNAQRAGQWLASYQCYPRHHHDHFISTALLVWAFLRGSFMPDCTYPSRYNTSQ